MPPPTLRCRHAFFLTVPIAFMAACGDFDRYDDRIFDFPAQAEPPVPHPTPYVPEPQSEPAFAEEETTTPNMPAVQSAAIDTPTEIASPSIVQEAETKESRKRIRRDEGFGRHRAPPIDAPHKNVGLKPDKKFREAALKDDADTDGRRQPRPSPRPAGSRSKEGGIKKSALSSARDGD